nr:class I SAM-dependent methyltransferase [Pseudomonadota bacterium]
LQHWPQARVDMLDVDTLALLAAAENVPQAHPVTGSDLQAVGQQRYDMIISNPPIHNGNREDHTVLKNLIADTPDHLEKGGRLVLVVQSRLPAGEWMKPHLDQVECLATTTRFRVWQGLRT